MTYSAEWQAEIAKSHGEMLDTRVSIRPVTYGASTNLWNWTTDNVSYPVSSGDVGPSSASTISYPDPPTYGSTRKLEHYEYGQIEFTINDEAFENATTATFSIYLHASTTENYDGGANPYDQLKFGVRNVSQDDSAGVNINRVDYGGGTRNDFVIPMLSGDWGTEIISYSMSDRLNEISITNFWRRFQFTFNWNSLWQPEDDLIFFIHGPGVPSAPTAELIWSSPMIEIDVDEAGDYFEALDEATYPGELFELGDHKDTIAMNPVVRKRERKFGVIQGQETQITVGNVDLNKLELSRPGSLIAVEMGFPAQDLWELAVQGTVASTKSTTDLKLFINIADPIRNIINSKLDKDVFFSTGTWASEISGVSVDEASDSYDNENYGITLSGTLSGSVKDEVYQIRFISDTEYLVYNSQDLPLSDITGDFVETGTTFATSGTTGFGPRELSNQASNVIGIGNAGWTQGEEHYTSGDTFQFTTSYARTVEQLTPLGMVRHIIEDVLNVRVFDVLGGGYYSTPLFDDSTWDDKVDASEGEVGGEWKSGSRVIEMLQDALILEHATIFSTETGQIGIWVVDGAQPGATYLNGMPGDDVVNILSASMTIDNDEFANVINIEYKDLSTGDDKTQAIESLTKDRPRTEMNLKTKWRVQDATIRNCISRALTRFDYDRKIYEITSPLSLANVDLADPITITEPFLGISAVMAEVTERHLNITDQSVKLVGWNDKLATLNKARIGATRIGQTDETIW